MNAVCYQLMRLPIFCALLYLATSLPAADPSLTVANVRSLPGLTPEVPAIIRSVTNVVAVQFDLAYNATRVAALDALIGSAPADHVVRSREISPGLRRVLIYSPENSAITLTNIGGQTIGVLVNIPFFVPRQERGGSGPNVTELSGDVHAVRKNKIILK